MRFLLLRVEEPYGALPAALTESGHADRDDILPHGRACLVGTETRRSGHRRPQPAPTVLFSTRFTFWTISGIDMSFPSAAFTSLRAARASSSCLGAPDTTTTGRSTSPPSR